MGGLLPPGRPRPDPARTCVLGVPLLQPTVAVLMATLRPLQAREIPGQRLPARRHRLTRSQFQFWAGRRLSLMPLMPALQFCSLPS